MNTRLQETLGTLQQAESAVGLARVSLAGILAGKDTWRPMYYAGLLEKGALDLLEKLDLLDTATKAHVAAIQEVTGVHQAADTIADAMAALTDDERAALSGTIQDVQEGYAEKAAQELPDTERGQMKEDLAPLLTDQQMDTIVKKTISPFKPSETGSLDEWKDSPVNGQGNPE